MMWLRPKGNVCVRIPLDVKGCLYVSPMPSGSFDTGNKLFKIYRKLRIEVVVVLVTDEELEQKAECDVLAAYQENGIEPIRFPIEDFTSPELYACTKVVDQVTDCLCNGSRIAMHCNAGVGRTSVMAGCIVRNITGKTAPEAIDYVKQYMHVRMNDEQMRLVDRFVPLAERLGSAEGFKK